MILRGVVVSFSSGTYLADVRLDGGQAQPAVGVPVSRACPSASMVAGAVVLLVQTGIEAGELVVVAVL